MSNALHDMSEQEDSDDTAAEPAPSTDDAPTLSFIKGWKTSVLFSALGLLGSFVVLIACRGGAVCTWLARLIWSFSQLPWYIARSISSWTLTLLIAVIGIVYSVVYASRCEDYLAGRRALNSRMLASFLNCFFGGILFGPMFNSHMTDLSKGLVLKGKPTRAYRDFCISVLVASLIVLGSYSFL